MSDKYDQNELQKDIDKLLEYVNIIRANGGLNIFSGLFQTDYRIMSYLATHPDAHPSDMADVLSVTRPNVAANLRLLEQKKYIVREVDKENRRQVYVNMTSEGREYLEKCDKQLHFLFAGWFSLLGREETSHLLKILEISASPSVISDEIREIVVGQ
jgi:DNA-binding MarR family transcriptional regulator